MTARMFWKTWHRYSGKIRSQHEVRPPLNPSYTVVYKHAEGFSEILKIRHPTGTQPIEINQYLCGASRFSELIGR